MSTAPRRTSAGTSAADAWRSAIRIARVLAVEGGEDLGQPQGVGGRGRHAHRAAHDAGVLVHLPAGLRRLGEDPLGAHQEVLAGGRQGDATARAPQQRHTELRLQPPDLLRERRLGDVRGLGGAAEMAVPGDRDEVLELTQLHACNLVPGKAC